VDPSGTISVGVAAHIRAASPGGPRYDAGQAEEDRISIENAIWLCEKCAALIDKSGGVDFPPDLLHKWKQMHERALFAELGGSADYLERVWLPNLAQIDYINVPRLAMLAAQYGIKLRRNLWQDTQRLSDLGGELNELLLDVERVLRDVDLLSIPLDQVADLSTDVVGLTVSFESAFRTKNFPDAPVTGDELRSLSGAWQKDPHIYRKVNNRRLVMVLDPRWITTSTAYVDFQSGHTRLGGVCTIKSVNDTEGVVLASPLVVGIPIGPLHPLLDEKPVAC
jgi:hypothetical protein